MTLTAVPGVRVGHAQVAGGGSGCTVILGPFRGAVEIRGLATGSRELDVLSPQHVVERVTAVLLSGGSAFGLAAADGVMAWLEEMGEGYETLRGIVPLVPSAVIFDLSPGQARPGAREGRLACGAASPDPVPEGRVGAGAGATVGKTRGLELASPGGLGSASVTLGGHTVGALAVVNALGDVLAEDGSVLVGARGGAGGAPGSSTGGGGEEPSRGFLPTKARDPGAGTNTTLVVVATDAPLSRADLARLARMASGAFSRTIRPVNTPFDGDILFALSTSPEAEIVDPGQLLAIGEAAGAMVDRAIRRAVSPELRKGGEG